MFGTGATYHMVPISLAIGVFLPFPFYIMVKSIFAHSQVDMLTEPSILAPNLAQGRIQQSKHLYHHAVFLLPFCWYQHFGQVRSHQF